MLLSLLNKRNTPCKSVFLFHTSYCIVLHKHSLWQIQRPRRGHWSQVNNTVIQKPFQPILHQCSLVFCFTPIKRGLGFFERAGGSLIEACRSVYSALCGKYMCVSQNYHITVISHARSGIKTLGNATNRYQYCGGWLVIDTTCWEHQTHCCTHTEWWNFIYRTQLDGAHTAHDLQYSLFTQCKHRCPLRDEVFLKWTDYRITVQAHPLVYNFTNKHEVAQLLGQVWLYSIIWYLFRKYLNHVFMY